MSRQSIEGYQIRVSVPSSLYSGVASLTRSQRSEPELMAICVILHQAYRLTGALASLIVL